MLMYFIEEKEVVLGLLKKFPVSSILSRADEFLRDDEEVIFTAVKEDGEGLEYASERLRNDKDFVLKIVEESPLEIQYVSDSLKKDVALVLKAYEGDDEVLKFIDKELAVLIERIDSIGNLKEVSKIFFKS